MKSNYSIFSIIGIVAIALIFFSMFLFRNDELSHKNVSRKLRNGITNKHDKQSSQKLAEFVYQLQKSERKVSADPNYSRFTPNFPCLWSEEATGDMSTWEEHWDKYNDGWKYTCGLRHITSPCIVYSLGSCGNMAFEKELLRVNPTCEVYIFDRVAFGIEDWFPEESVRSKVHFTKAFISSKTDSSQDPPHITLKDIMKKFDHSHIDVLKMDIEGSEWDILTNNDAFPSIGQLQVEFHLINQPEPLELLTKAVDNIESHGLRLFHKETNLRDSRCAEFAFIQKDWSPEKKIYL